VKKSLLAVCQIALPGNLPRQTLFEINGVRETKFCLSLGGVPHRSYLVASRGGEVLDIESLSHVAADNL
jgi:hypothetical protein